MKKIENHMAARLGGARAKKRRDRYDRGAEKQISVFSS